jgi:hypothetical protein
VLESAAQGLGETEGDQIGRLGGLRNGIPVLLVVVVVEFLVRGNQGPGCR